MPGAIVNFNLIYIRGFVCAGRAREYAFRHKILTGRET